MSPDLTIASALNDPLIRAVMKADRVNPLELEITLRATAKRLESASERLPFVPTACRAAAGRGHAWSFCFA